MIVPYNSDEGDQVFGSSQLLTVGHALDRAREENMVVRVNILGEWVTGQIVKSDGHGVAILEDNGDMCVVRQEAISCVRLPAHATNSGGNRPTTGARPTPAKQHPKLETA